MKKVYNEDKCTSKEKGGLDMQPSDFVSIYGEMAEIVGTENTYKLFEHFRGQSATFPQRLYSTQYVEKYVKEHYDGTNLREFAKKFNYSERRIRQFLYEHSETN